jgi:site-specific DNA recombinase
VTTRCIVYARFSSDLQRDQSIDDQVRVCRARADREGWTVVDVLPDYATSGSNILRPGFQALAERVRNRAVDVVLTESLDRLSRDQEHIAGFYKQARFANCRIVTLSEGEVSELHIGLKGTMGALFLRDLADKTRRGLEGRVRQGRSGGGLCFGYRVCPGGPRADGEVDRGLREIDHGQAEAIRRIFRDYAAGLSPKRVAAALNEAGISSPRGGTWTPSAIHGDRASGTGILNNELYVGRLVWNRRRWSRNPDTGKRVARANAPDAIVTEPVPHLRIVPDELWEAVRARQARLDRQPSGAIAAGAPRAAFWTKQRPRHLFSGLLRCGACGGGFAKTGRRHFGCSTARNKGAAVCSNRLTVRDDVLEETVLGALRDRLMDPELYTVFAAEFTRTWNRLQADASAGSASHHAELERVKVQLERLVDAVVGGASASALRSRLDALEARRLQLEAELALMNQPTPRLHPHLATLYREKVATLSAALPDEDAAEARDCVRGLIEKIRLIPLDGLLRVAVRGELGAILRLAAGAAGCGAAGSDVSLVFLEQIKRDAGTGFEPVTFRL